jgi:hypothetical protein
MEESKSEKPVGKEFYDAYVKGFESEYEHRQKLVVEFDKIAIQSLITLNSTLLFAVPTFTALIERKELFNIVKYPMTVFSFGLICAFVSLYLTRISGVKFMENSKYLANHWTNKIYQHFVGTSIKDKDPLKPDFFGSEERAAALEKLGINYAKAGEKFEILSALSLLAGILVFGSRLS